MAILELGIQLNGLQQASAGLQNLQNQLNGLNRNNNGVNINLPNTSSQINAASDSILGLRSRLNELLKTYGSLSESQRQSGRVQNNLVAEINRLREAVNRANVEYNNLRRGTGQPIPSDSIVGMRQRLNELRKVYDNLSASQRNSARVQNNLVTEINRINQAVSQAERATGRFQRNVGNYSSALGSASGVTMEFNRIIQDAPFGMMGIGNNIQQLAANWQHYTTQARAAAAANGTTIGTMGLLKGVMATMLSPANLLTLGIAAVTSAWTYYSMNVKTAKEETKDMNNQFTTQVSQLQNIISLTQKSAKTERDKATAISEYNKNLGDTLGKVKSYGELEQKLIKNGASYVQYLSLKAQAEATYQIALKRTTEMMNNIMSLESKGRSGGFLGWVAKASDTIDELVYGVGSQGKTKITADEARRIAQLPTDKEFYIAIRGMGDALKRGLKDVRADWKRQIKASGLGSDLTLKANALADAIGNIPMPDLGLDKDKNSSKKAGELVDYLQKIKDLLADKQKDLDLINLDGQARDLKELEWKYKEFFSELDKLEKKYKADKNKNKQTGVLEEIKSARKTGVDLQTKERLEIEKKWLDERIRLTEEANNKWGFVTENSREKDLKNLKIYLEKYQQEMLKAGATIEEVTEKIAGLNTTATFKINVEFYKKELDAFDAENDKIAESINKPFSLKSRQKMQDELRKREFDLRQSLERQAELARSLFGSSAGTKEQIEEVVAKAKVQWQIEIDENSKTLFRNFLVNTINSAYNELFQNMKSNVEQFGSTFRALFYSIGETIQSTFQNINTESISNIFEKFKTEGWEAVTALDRAVAGLATAGNLISSMTSKSSVAGQGIGGALSGAASGLAVGDMLKDTLGKNGGLIGAIAGAGIGLISGILGAGKRKKEEERQRQQLEEQKKTNALLERMNALAYTSQIIGGKTTNGIVTGVNRNEFGEITVRIEGRDLVGSFNRTNTLSGR